MGDHLLVYAWWQKHPARVLKVHYDDDPPYYSIEMEGGAERSTICAYLVPLTAQEEVLRLAGNAISGRRLLKVELPKQGRLGVTLENGVDDRSPPILTAMSSDGAAERSGLLLLGDLIAWVNGHFLVDHAQAASVVSNMTGKLTILLLRVVRPPHPLQLGHGFGSIGPVAAYVAQYLCPQRPM